MTWIKNMRYLLLLLLYLPLNASANFIMQYGLNYSSQTDGSSAGEFEESRIFHKGFIGASINGERTLFFGWNINSWTSSLSQGTSDADTYSMLEMGPRLQWFVNDNHNLYFTAEWNPYATGERDKASTSKDITGSSIGFGFGYRFKINRVLGLGASLNYHSLSITNEKLGTTEDTVSDSVTNMMPMLEFTIITR
jgi:hypothetical protein